MPIKVLIADGDPVTTTWFKSILEPEDCVVDAVGTGGLALENIESVVPDLFVLDAVLPDGDGLEIVRELRKNEKHKDLHIIVLSTLDSPTDIAASMQAGADDYILKRPGADLELIGKIRALSTQTKKDSGRARIFSFCSAKGGSGTTSVCVNTAYAFVKENPAIELLIVDMVFPMGTVGQSLGYDSSKTISKLTHEAIIDPSVLAKYVSPKLRWGFSLLLGANDPHEATELEVDQIVPLFDALRKQYDYIFVDFGRTLSRISLPIIESSDGIVLVLSPDISTVRGTRRVLDFLASRDISLERVFIVNNRTVGRVWTSAEDIERELGLRLNVTIPYTVEYMTLAINDAVPFMLRFPENSASSAFTGIAQELHSRANR
jgi:pilus assembly protein CpaE